MAIATLTIDLVAKLANLERDMGKAAHIAEKNAAKMDAAFKTVATSLSAIGATLSVGAFAAMVRSVADAGDSMAKLSTKTGVAVEELSKLQYAASLSDASTEDLGSGLSRLNKLMGEAADGSESATAALARFGISPGDGKNTIQAFTEIAERVKNTGDVTKTSSALNDVFGRSYQTLLPLLKSGRDGLKDTGDELERIGGVMSGDLARSSEEFNDNITRLTTQMTALKLEAIGPIIPLLVEVSAAMVGTSEKTDGLSASGQALKTIFETIAVLGANVAFVFNATGREIGGMAAQITALASGDFKSFSNIGAAMREDAEKARKEVDELTDRLLNPRKAGGSASGGGVSIADASPGTTKPKTGKKEKDSIPEYLLAAEAYEKALVSVYNAQQAAEKSLLGLNGAQEAYYDLVNSPVWEQMPQQWRDVATAQAEVASEAIKAAEGQRRLNELIEATPTAALEKTRQDMQLLADAFDKGVISADQMSEAISERLGNGVKESINKQKSAAEELGVTFSSAFEDAIVKGEEFSEVLKGIGEDILRIMIRKSVTEPLAKSISGLDFGDMFSGLLPFAKGGVHNSPSLSAYSGGVYSSPKLFAFANGAGVFGEAGPEAIMPLSRGKDGKLGVSMSGGGSGDVSVNVSVDAKGTSAEGNTNQSKQLGLMIGSAVRSVIMQEKRVGGMLA